ncbi:MAG: winged helix-turn-helix transcriptional regulator [Methylobacteriaceae bacterium]|nr:winged helix-turn-helix transcriptional regulator [Methylobacteriaceae bacterium]
MAGIQTRKSSAPVRKNRNAQKPKEQPIGGLLADEFIAVLVTSIATRLSRGSTDFFRSRWNIGMIEWRVLLVLERTEALNVRELAVAAALDKAAVSRSLAAMQAGGLVEIEQTRSRGRAAFAKLTPAGRKLAKKLLRASRLRQQRLFEVLPARDVEMLAALLQRFADALTRVGWDAPPRAAS